MRTLLRTARFMSISTGPAYQATTPMRPPRFTLSRASCIEVGPPAHSSTESAPLPPVTSATRRGSLSSRTLTSTSAPSRTDLEALRAGAGQDDALRPQRLAELDGEEADGTR